MINEPCNRKIYKNVTKQTSIKIFITNVKLEYKKQCLRDVLWMFNKIV